MMTRTTSSCLWTAGSRSEHKVMVVSKLQCPSPSSSLCDPSFSSSNLSFKMLKNGFHRMRIAWRGRLCPALRADGLDEAPDSSPARIAYCGRLGSGVPPGLNFKPNKLVLLFWPILARFSTVKHHSSVVWTLLVNY
ncbi:hypothetical protein E3N88_36594 [Mikania micrantha]|uniref:Uncharacterized protein n=1 Tax=Mikania micrantha TaxID=192012 RepID=A0A5N6M440_9ASTR|nr:hypothetical protein E3N88_36594 [Mikania micrantha]